MKLTSVSLALATCLTTVVAQGQGGAASLSDLPSCARSCATNAIPKQCNIIDVRCICADQSFINGISCCVADACSPSDQQSVIKFATQICSGAGVKNLPTSASCSTGASTATTGTATGAGATTGTETGSATSGMASGASSTAANTSGSSGSSASGSSTASSASAAATSGAAALSQNKEAGLVAALGAAAFAILA